MIESAGVTVIDINSGDPITGPTVLCVRAYANWDFPKGELNGDEVHMQAAIREVEEETTLKHGADYILTGSPIGQVTYGSGAKQKTATYYAGLRMSKTEPYLPVSEELGKPENDEYRWVPLDELKGIMPSRLHKICDNVISEYENKKNDSAY
jgi:8-oxo-dGTP pyrophosphatase MutT (NUDIX family)